jgi:hypothetical protein
MVQVAVGEKNAVHLEPGLVQRGEDAGHVAARVDHRAAPSFRIPDQGTVLLEARDRDLGGLRLGHGSSLTSAAGEINGRIEGAGMSRRSHKSEEIAAKLRQVAVLTAQGKPVAEAVGLRKAVADLTLEKLVLKEAASGIV